MTHGFQDVFNWGFIGSFVTASTAVVAIANTLRQWLKLEPRWSALAAAVVLTFYAAGYGDPNFTIGRFFAVLGHGVLLCCYAVGLQATVAGIGQRVMGAARAGAQPGWWSAWF